MPRGKDHFPINMFGVQGFLWGRESDYNTSLYKRADLSKQKSLAQSECSRQTLRLDLTAESDIRYPDVFSQSLRYINLSLVDSIPPKSILWLLHNLQFIISRLVDVAPHSPWLLCTNQGPLDENQSLRVFFGEWRSGDFVLLFGVQGVQPPKLPS